MTDYYDLVAASNPLAWWRLDETGVASGSTIVDYGSGGNNLSIFSSVLDKDQWSPGKGHWCYRASASNTAYRAASSSILSFEYNQAFSFHGWLWSQSAPTSGAILSKIVNSSPYIGYDLFVLSGAANIRWQLNNNADTLVGIYRDFAVQSSFWSGWHHFAATYDGTGNRSGLHFYIDGFEPSYADGPTATLAATIASSATFALLSRNTSAAPLTSRCLSEVCVYNRELSSTEVLEFATFSPSLPSLVVSDTGGLRSVSRPAKNLRSLTTSSSGKKRKRRKVNPGLN